MKLTNVRSFFSMLAIGALVSVAVEDAAADVWTVPHTACSLATPTASEWLCPLPNMSALSVGDYRKAWFDGDVVNEGARLLVFSIIKESFTGTRYQDYKNFWVRGGSFSESVTASEVKKNADVWDYVVSSTYSQDGITNIRPRGVAVEK